MSFALSAFVRIRGAARGAPAPASGKELGLVNRRLWSSHGVVSIGEQASDPDGAGGVDALTSSHAVYGPFHGVLGPALDQSCAFDALGSSLVRSFLTDDLNCTIFAYGQTGSGKTHTLFGPPGSFELEPNGAAQPDQVDAEWGVCPKAILAIASESDGAALKLSAVEVYLEEVFDLLNNKARVAIAGFGKNTKSKGPGLIQSRGATRDADGKWVPPTALGSGRGEFSVRGVVETDVTSVEDVLQVMRVVEVNRSATAHDLNDRSSRSHCLVTLTKTSTSRDRRSSKTSRFLFVDLAGSERIAKTNVGTYAAAGETEAKNINQSLTSLGRCILALKKQSAGSAFIPWRDSALTMLMKQSLAGNCRTALVVCATDDPRQVQETRSSLRFGVTASALRTRAASVQQVNRTDVLENLRVGLRQADEQLQQFRDNGGHGHLDAGHPKSTQDGFVQNFVKLREAERTLEQLQVSRDSAGGEAAGLTQFIHNQKGLLIRQITTGIWREPHPTYVKKMRARQQLLLDLQRYEASDSAAVSMSLVEQMSLLTIQDLVRGAF